MVRELYRKVGLDLNLVAGPLHAAGRGHRFRDSVRSEVAPDLDLGVLALSQLNAALLAENDFRDLEVKEGIVLRVEPTVALKMLISKIVPRCRAISRKP